MRRTILSLSAFIVLMAIAPSAAAIPKEPKGCAAGRSVWTEVDYIPVSVIADDWMATGFYDWYWTIGDGAAIEAFRAVAPGWSDEQIYFFFAAGSFPNIVDRNADQNVCVSWLGANPGVPDQYISIIDNNSNAQH